VAISKETVSTAVQDKIQPWQAVFTIFTFALTQFDIGETNTVILLGMILTTLGFVMRSTYKHKEAVKEIVAPWLLQQLLQIASEYLAPTLPEPPEEAPVEPVETPELTKNECLARLLELGVKVE
jgi:hypothetical protein